MKLSASALVVALVVALLGSCASKDKGTETESLRRYRHSDEFLFEQVGQELDERWNLATRDRSKLEFLTEWRTNLAPVSYQGFRHRLRVRIDGDLESGYAVLATQETERNEELENPLAPEEAEWEPAGSDNGLAIRFLRHLDARLTPQPAFQSEEVR